MAKAERSDRVKKTASHLKKGILKGKDQQIQVLLDNGLSLNKIAKTLKVCVTALRYQIQEKSLESTRAKEKQIDPKRLKQLYKEGVPANQIAKEFSCSLYAVYNHAKKLGLKRERNNVQFHKKSIIEVNKTKIKKLLREGSTRSEIAKRFKIDLSFLCRTLKKMGGRACLEF